MSITRKSIQCKIFGAPCDMKETVLPSIASVLRCLKWEVIKLKTAGKNVNVVTNEAVRIVAHKAEKIWERASIPVLSQQRIIALVQREHQTLLKNLKNIKPNAVLPLKIAIYKKNCDKLFDIAACKCLINQRCDCKFSKKVFYIFILFCLSSGNLIVFNLPILSIQPYLFARYHIWKKIF